MAMVTTMNTAWKIKLQIRVVFIGFKEEEPANLERGETPPSPDKSVLLAPWRCISFNETVFWKKKENVMLIMVMSCFANFVLS